MRQRPKLLKGGELASTSASCVQRLVWNYVVGNYLRGTAAAFDLLY